MLSDVSAIDHIYIACGYTDLRLGIDGLSSIVKQRFSLDPYRNSLFLFCGRRADRIKGLLWQGDGFLLLYKRLETEAYQWPRSSADMTELSEQQYRWLMEGLTTEPRRSIIKVLCGRFGAV